MLFVHELLDRAAARHPGRVALRTRERTVAYEALRSESSAEAARYRSLRVGPGDRVAIVLENSVAAVRALYATSRCGATAVLCDPQAKSYGVRRTLADVEPVLVVTTPERADVIDAAPRDAVIVHATDGRMHDVVGHDGGLPRLPTALHALPAALIYTSGTASTPRGIMATHANVAFTTDAIQRCLALSADDVIGLFLPLSFDYGLYQLFLAAEVGATVAIGTPGMVGPGLLTAVDAWGVTVLPALPSIASTVVRLARRDPAKVARLRCITNTGGHLSPAVADDLAAACPAADVIAMYGLTECKRVSILASDDRRTRPTSVGRALPGTRVAVEEDGELVVEGPNVTAGYWRSPRETALRFRPAEDGGRRLFTGDRVDVDADGYLYFRRRLGDVYKHRDYRVSPAEIEAVALDIPDVRLAALVPPEGERGPVLFVEADCGEAQVWRELARRLEAPKLPDRLAVLAVLPRTRNGKVDKTALATEASSAP